MLERLCLRLPFRWLLRLIVAAGAIVAQPALSQATGLRLSLELGPQHLRQVALTDAASAEQRSLLRIEWQAATSGIDEASTLDDMLKRLARMEITARELLRVLKSMPTTPSTLNLTPPAATPAPAPMTPDVVATSLTAATPSPGKEIDQAPTAPARTMVELAPQDQRKPIAASVPADAGFDFGSSLPLSVKLIGAVTLLLALSLAAYRWLMTHTPQTDPNDGNRPSRYPPYLGGAIRKAHQAQTTAPHGGGLKPN